MENLPILVSIRCTAFNHEKFIRQCMDGFVMQKTNFRFEAIVHDDASTDGTASIIQEYAIKYPDIIVPVLQTENQFSKGNGILTKILDSHMRGKYIAFCEGDDYWTDPYKLQKQVDYLESHNDCGIVYSKARRWNENRKQFGADLGHEVSCFNELLKKNVVPTLTVMYRKELTEGYWDIISKKNWLMGDFPLWLYISSKSDIHFFNEFFGVYREHGGSATHLDDMKKREAFCSSVREVQLLFCELNHIDPWFVNDEYYKTLYFNSVFFKDFKRAFNYYSLIERPSFKVRMSYIKNKIKYIFKKV